MIYQINPKYKNIWDAAFKYQDVRNDKGHAFLVTVYAQDICQIESANPDVAVPAAILHDIGWSKLPVDEKMSVFIYGVAPAKKLEIRIKHQEAGVEIAKEILTALQYPEKLSREVLEIILQHDTRQGFLNKNDGAMRDADKLWRFDDYGFLNDNQNGGYTFSRDLLALDDKLKDPGFFYFESSLNLARGMFTNLREKYRD